ncbi:hypothetical protein CYLTODRAFT_444462 [Cylindrobasidium torrendii FP15055 ss-10]|uniref:Uncharacterized protein n=1 Tax=Cylindrobasidium torrendii FP15055 ss-10 TaxID=1314674 RepID=A0A0D7B8I2_9AGAR|nr:hypothetical protein CYLTODRAFT_444462 [Cylindrobasidium torrendii FP15055 ss-10]
MSLPPAPQDLSAHPAKGSVIDPVNKEAKDADVQRKIKLYNAINAIRDSRLPSNKQLDAWLDYAITHPPLDISDLSKDGQGLVHDVQDILKTLRSLIQEKNGDELIQEWIWGTRVVDGQTFAGGVKGKGAETIPDKDKVKEDASTASQHVRSLVHLVLTNGEFRKLISDFSVVARDLAARGAVKAAENIRPNQEQLERVDEAAKADHFHQEAATSTSSPIGQSAGTQTSVPGTREVVGQPQTVDQAKVEADNAKLEAERLKEAAKEEVRDVVDRNGDVDSQEAKGKVAGLFNRVKEAIPQAHKDKANDQFTRGKEFLADEYFPKERREQWIYRAKKVLIECQRHPDYQESITWLLDFAEEYVRHGQNIAEGHAAGVGEVSKDPALDRTLGDLRTIVERSPGGKTLELIKDPLDALVDDARRDPELRRWFAEGRDWLRDVLLKTGYVLEPASGNAFDRWVDNGKAYYGEEGKYREHFNRLFDGAGTFVKGIGEDPGNRRFGSDWAKLTRDLLFASDGQLVFKKDLWTDIRKVVVPMLIEKVGYVPIPRIEYTDDSIDLVVENLTLSGRNLFPNVVGIEAHNYVKFSPYAKVQDGLDENKHEIKLTFDQIQADMRDVAFYFSKKSGIPKLKDSGLADVVLGGSGLSATVHLISSSTTDPTSIFTIKKVHVKVDTLKFSIRDSKHDFLYKTLKPLATGLVKKQIEKAVGDAIRTGFEYVDGLLVTARQRMDEEKAKEDGLGRTGVLKETFSHKKAEAEETASSVSRSSSQFKVVSNKRESLLANKGHPSGWVNRVEKPKEGGDTWKSELFDIQPVQKL